MYARQHYEKFPSHSNEDKNKLGEWSGLQAAKGRISSTLRDKSPIPPFTGCPWSSHRSQDHNPLSLRCTCTPECKKHPIAAPNIKSAINVKPE